MRINELATVATTVGTTPPAVSAGPTASVPPAGQPAGGLAPQQAAMAAKQQQDQKKALQDQIKQVEQQLQTLRKQLADIG